MENGAFTFVVSTLTVYIVCVVPGIIVGRELSKRGFVRDYKIKPVVLTAALIVFMRLLTPNVPLSGLVVLGLLFSTLGIYRGDFYNTSTHGAWWWKQESKLNRPFIDALISLVIIGIVVGVILALTGRLF